MNIFQLETQRLRLRQWKNSDLFQFSELNADPNVMEYLPKILTNNESDEMAERCKQLIIERGWGLWALELKDADSFIGFVGLHTPKSILPFSPCVEIGWRLARQYWGRGYATEAGKQAVAFAFNNLAVDELVSFASVHNLRSQNVMRRLGFKNSQKNFFHPDLPAGHYLSEHVLYKLTHQQWLELS